MSYEKKKRPGMSRQAATMAMAQHQAQSGVRSDLYWAQLDTLCQTLPWVPREERKEMLYHNWKQWIGGDIPPGLLYYYEGWMCGFYLPELPFRREHVFIQAGSLMAKLEWVHPTNYTLDVTEMHRLCMQRLEQLPQFDRLPQRIVGVCRSLLLDILNRYTDVDQMCSEQVRMFFMDNYSRYETALAVLVDKLNASAEVPSQNEIEAEKKSQEEQTQSLQTTSVEKKAVLQNEDGMVGLCNFIEKTSSVIYQRALSQLYALYKKPAHEVSGKAAQMYLRDFFAALLALEIEPVNEERFRTEFPEEYYQEVRRRSSDPEAEYTMVACGWSCNGYLITNPVFYKNIRRGDKEHV